MDVFEQAAARIIKEQETIIGPVAIEQANKVAGLKVDPSTRKVSISGNGATVLNQLVKQYQGLFGQTSVEVCKEAVASMLSKFSQVPSLLR